MACFSLLRFLFPEFGKPGSSDCFLGLFLLVLFVWNSVLAFAYLSGLIPHSGQFSWMELILNLPELPEKVLNTIAKPLRDLAK